MNTAGLFRAAHPQIVEKVFELAYDADCKEKWGLLTAIDRRDLNLRVVELHTVSKRGGLGDKHHYDSGSLVTVDVMCSSPGIDFDGGNFNTLEADSSSICHEFRFGDAIIFPSHKYHCVQPVSSGTRSVFVIELWEGEERHCAHRCQTAHGACEYSLTENKIEQILTAAFPEIDPT